MCNKTEELIKFIKSSALEIIGEEELFKKLRSGKKIQIKHGMDPTATHLHLGYAVSYNVMRRFQDLGHTVQFLFGDFTTRIGDPTDREDVRASLSLEDIQNNKKECLRQIHKILKKENTVIYNNSDWFEKMTLHDFFKIAQKVSAVRLWDRDMFKKRVENEKPVWTHEFLYPILQAYDSVEMKSDLTVIGSDQKFNELLGRTFQQIYGQSPQALIIMPILPGTDGKLKMGQSFNNYIGIDEEAEQQFGKVMSIPDELIFTYIKLCTQLDEQQIEDYKNRLECDSVNPMEIKLELASHIVEFYHGKDKALQAKAFFDKTIRNNELPDDMQTVMEKSGNYKVMELFNKHGLSSSNSDFKRLVKQNGMKINKEPVKDFTSEIDLEAGKHYILQRGKRQFIKISVQD